MKIKQQGDYLKNYYWTIDGVYNSYWLGKMMNAIMRSGTKKTIKVSFTKVIGFFKLKYKTPPVEGILEGLERVKPLFRLGYVTIAGKKREFPKLLSKHKQLLLSTAWFNNLILTRKERELSLRIFNELQDLKSAKRYSLIKRRDGLLISAVKARFNLRFAY